MWATLKYSTRHMGGRRNARWFEKWLISTMILKCELDEPLEIIWWISNKIILLQTFSQNSEHVQLCHCQYVLLDCDRCGRLRFHISNGRYWNYSVSSIFEGFPFQNLNFFRQKLKDFDADAIMVIGVATTNILWIYLHCYLGKSVTERYDALPDHLFHSRWYSLPIELQMYFILLLVNTQEPLYFHGLGMYILNMGTFSAVSRKLFIIF